VAADITPIELGLTDGNVVTLWAPRWREDGEEWEAFLGHEEDLFVFPDAARLAAFCAPFPHQINLIPWNAHAGPDFRAPTEAELDRFVRALLEKTRAVVTVRRSRGRDVGAACGQLVRARVPHIESPRGVAKVRGIEGS
jgi:hypothetical protein